MSGLSGSMLIALHSLLVQESALNATSNNIANANTPGYSREVPILSEADPTVEGGIVYGHGVSLDQIASVRDRLLELRIYDATSQQSGSQAELTSLQQVENYFTDPTQGIGADITAFFNSLNRLSTDPTSVPQRQAVLTAASNLAGDFHNTVTQLSSIQQNLNLNVTQSVNQVNQLTSQIAKYNQQVASMQKLGQDAGTIEDQRNELIRQLSEVTDISVIQSDSGYTITTANGSALVVGGQSFNLDTSLDSNGMRRVLAGGQDITSTISGGSLGGYLKVRDQFLPGVLSSLDDLAGGLATNFNAAHQSGFDLSGNAGQQFFSAVSGGGAASSFSVLITDPSQIAASSDGSAGSNGNIALMQAVQDQQLPSGQKPLESYSNIVFTVGNATSQSQAASDASELSLRQLTNQRQAVSGVSIDEETTNLIRFQHAFAAAARVITTIDEMTQTVLAMGSPTA